MVVVHNRDPTKNCENTLIERTPKTIFKASFGVEKTSFNTPISKVNSLPECLIRNGRDFFDLLIVLATRCWQTVTRRSGCSYLIVPFITCLD